MNFMTLLFCIFLGFLIYKAFNTTTSSTVNVGCTDNSDCGPFLACLPSGLCANPNDPLHCGVANVDCTELNTANVCQGGQCFCGSSAPCQNLTPICYDNRCVDEYDHDPSNCGSLGNECVESKCNFGVCTCENNNDCPTNTTCDIINSSKCYCNNSEQGDSFCASTYGGMAAKDTCCLISENPSDNGCTNIYNDVNNCGGCGRVLFVNISDEIYCNEGAGACVSPELTYCSEVGCVDTNTDINNCGECDLVLDQNPDYGASICSEGVGACANNSYEYCIGLGCTDLTNDVLNCGECGNGLRQNGDGPASCVLGAAECESGLQYCDNNNGGCVNKNTNKSNCGACNNPCPDDLGLNKVGVCISGNCAYEDAPLGGG